MSEFVTDVQNSQEITHEKILIGCEDAAQNFVRTVQGLGETLGPLLLPPGFTVEGIKALDAFLRELPEDPSYAVGIRHKIWIDSELPDLLREHSVALTLVDYPGMARLEESGVEDRFLKENKTVSAYANNHYQNHSPSIFEKFLEIRRGERS